MEISALDARPFAEIAAALGEARDELIRLRREELARRPREKLIATALGPDLAGRPFAELLRLVANDMANRGGGPLEQCLREKAAEVEAALEGP